MAKFWTNILEEIYFQVGGCDELYHIKDQMLALPLAAWSRSGCTRIDNTSYYGIRHSDAKRVYHNYEIGVATLINHIHLVHHCVYLDKSDTRFGSLRCDDRQSTTKTGGSGASAQLYAFSLPKATL